MRVQLKIKATNLLIVKHSPTQLITLACHALSQESKEYTVFHDSSAMGTETLVNIIKQSFIHSELRIREFSGRC